MDRFSFPIHFTKKNQNGVREEEKCEAQYRTNRKPWDRWKNKFDKNTAENEKIYKN